MSPYNLSQLVVSRRSRHSATAAGSSPSSQTHQAYPLHWDLEATTDCPRVRKHSCSSAEETNHHHHCHHQPGHYYHCEEDKFGDSKRCSYRKFCFWLLHRYDIRRLFDSFSPRQKRIMAILARLFFVVVGFAVLQFGYLTSTLQPFHTAIVDWPSSFFAADPTPICFVTSVYAPHISLADKVPPANLADVPNIRHFLFTNLPKLKPKGWTHVLMNNFTYSRLITHSRWSKFLAWQSPLIKEHCSVVFYMDGTYETASPPYVYRRLARRILSSNSTWMQKKHKKRKGIMTEIEAIKKERKDTPEHLQATVEWLESQPDFDPNATVFLNTWIGYNPHNPIYQNFTLQFWEEYSKETTSWRDQPLWTYLLMKNRIQPIGFRTDLRNLFRENKKSRGFGGHRYVDVDFDVDVVVDLHSSDATGNRANLYDDSKVNQTLPICFVTCVYAPEVHLADRVPPAALASEPNVHHFIFTNLEDFAPAGWTPVVMPNLEYERTITRSRYGKFMAWQVPSIRDKCSAVFYIDGVIETVASPLAYRRLATQILEAPERMVMQYPHNKKRQLGAELEAIERGKKDSPENVAKTLKWLQNQPGYDVNSTVYLNTFFGYNPNNPLFQSFTSSFWNEYASERTSWRDQPLWAYFIAKNNIKPLNFPQKSRNLFYEPSDARGFGGHTYVNSTNATVAQTA